MSNADCMEERVNGLCCGRAGALGAAKGRALDLGRSQKEHELIVGSDFAFASLSYSPAAVSINNWCLD